MKENTIVFCGENIPIPEHFVAQDQADFIGCVRRINQTLSGVFYEGMEESIPVEECLCELPVSLDVILELKRLCGHHGYVLDYDSTPKAFKISWPVGRIRVAHELYAPFVI